MAQEIINTGAAPNDGDGDNLRTAFTKVNNNFTQVWTAGPVGSNVQIQGNTISTLQVNQDLALSPNGVGNVRLNNNTIPGANNTWFLGSTTNRWRGLFVGNVTAGNVTINDGLTVPGDAYIGGNLTVVGDTIQIGNITTDTKTIQLANTASTNAAANGSGITVGANDNIATFLYNSTTNSWVTNLQVTYANGQPIGKLPGGSNTQIQFNDDGNFGGDSDLTYNKNTNTLALNGTLTALDATVYGQIAGVTGVFSGNVAANYYTGNGSQLTGIVATTISNTAPALGNGAIWWNSVDGRAYVKYANAFIDLSPSLVPDPTTYVGNVSFDDITVTNVGNVIPAANATYSLGSAAFQWSNLWVANNTIYLGGVPLGITTGNVLTINGEPILSNDSDTSITTTGNLTANIIIATESANLGSLNFFASSITMADDVWDNIFISPNGESQAYLSIPKDSVANVQNTRLHNDAGNIELGTGSGTNLWLFDSSGDLTAPGNISTTGNIDAPYIYGDTTEANVFTGGTANITGNVTAAYFIGDGSQLTGLPPGYTDSDVATFLAAYGSNTISTTGNVTAGNFIGAGSNVELIAQSEQWVFDTTGNLTLPTGGYLLVQTGIIGAGASPAPTLSGFSSIATTGVQGNISASGNLLAAGYANITGNVNGSGATFSGNVTAGNFIGNGSQLTAVNAVTVDVTNTNGLTTVYYPTFVENRTTGQTVRADVDLSYRTDINTLSVGNVSASGNVSGNYVLGNGAFLTGVATSYGNANVANFLANYGSNTIVTTGNITAANFIGNISITGNVQGTSANVELVAGSYQWTFNNTGNLVLPGNTFAVNYANGTAVSLGGGSSYGDSNVVTLLSAFGSNTIVTTGNVSGGNIAATGIVGASNNVVINAPSPTPEGGQLTLAWANVSGLTGQGNSTWNLDVDSTSNVRLFYQNAASATGVLMQGNVTGNLVSFPGAGGISVTGNITGGNLITTGNVSGNVSGFAIGYRDIPVLSLAANTTVSTSDAGKQYYSTSASPLTLTIANNASQGFQLGATINIVNQGAGNVSVLRGVGVTMYLAGNSTSSDRTLTSYGVASVTKVATDTWFISGVGLV